MLILLCFKGIAPYKVLANNVIYNRECNICQEGSVHSIKKIISKLMSTWVDMSFDQKYNKNLNSVFSSSERSHSLTIFLQMMMIYLLFIQTSYMDTEPPCFKNTFIYFSYLDTQYNFASLNC